jgi:four helix bundle protein
MGVAEQVYRVTRGFPPEERFGLVIQCRRAATSIAANIAEGHGRESRAYFAQFLRIAQGSAVELDTELDLSHRLGYLDDGSWESIHEQLDHVIRLIAKLRRAIAGR